jgi:hypothetical protein
MCVVENIGFINEKVPVKVNSNIRSIKNTSNRREISPRCIKGIRDSSPARIYSSVVARKKSPLANNYITSLRSKGNIQQLLQKMKEETEKLDNEVKNIEKWNQFSELEELETINSSETLS